MVKTVAHFSMTTLSILILSVLLLIHSVESVNKYHGAGGGWQSAHATFYGGGDASGTMGQSVSSFV